MDNNRNSYLGIFLIFLILLGYQLLNPIAETTEKKDSKTTEYIAQELNEVITEPSQVEITKNIEEQFFNLKNDFLSIDFSNKGGNWKKITLIGEKKYLHHQDKNDFPDIQFWEEKSKIDFEFLDLNQKKQSTADLLFEVVQKDEKSIDFIWKQAEAILQFSYVLEGKELHFQVEIKNMQNHILPNSLHWNFDFLTPAKEKNNLLDRNASTIFYKISQENKRDYLSETGEDQKKIQGNLDFLAFKTLYYSLIVLPEKKISFDADLHVENPKDENFVKKYTANFHLDQFNPFFYQEKFRFYIGSNDFYTLKALGNDAEEIINFGWGIVRYTNEYFVFPIFNFLLEKGVAVPFALLILTILIKLILLPLYKKSYISSAKMRALRPELEEINKKHTGTENSFKKQQAQLELYRKTGVNPMAGCLPLLAQMPLLFALFRFFPNVYQLRLVPFLWADDLSSYDSIYDLSFSIPIYGEHISLFTILFGISMIFYSQMNAQNMAQPTQEGMPDMRVLMYILPIFSILFFNSYAAGLSLYYFIANMISIAQTFLFRMLINDQLIRNTIENNKKIEKKPSKWEAKLAQLQKIQKEK